MYSVRPNVRYFSNGSTLLANHQTTRPNHGAEHDTCKEQMNDSPSFENKQRRLNYSQLKKAHKHRSVPELREEDLEESFVRGSSHPDVLGLTE
jgi:hypothetical protein